MKTPYLKSFRSSFSVLPIQKRYGYLLPVWILFICLSPIKAQQYTLRDNDVGVENGIIKSCSYNFEIKNIIIPQILDGQTVTEIGGNPGVFSNKGLSAIQLPGTLISIGNYAFSANKLLNIDLSGCKDIAFIGEGAFSANNLTTLDLSGNKKLVAIGNYAFHTNQLTSLTLSGCTALKSIGNFAFAWNKITSLQLTDNNTLSTIESSAFDGNQITRLDLSGCSALTKIGQAAFRSNKITSLDFTSCKALTTIDMYSFDQNNLSSVNLIGCKNILYIGHWAFAENPLLSGFDLPEVTYKGIVYKTWKDGEGNSFTAGTHKAVNLQAYYLPFIQYTLTDNDVVVENGIIQSCSYNFDLKNIIIPQILDGQTVTGVANGAEESKGIFYFKSICSIQFPVTLVSIGDYAFRSNFLSGLNLSGCINLSAIGQKAFYDNNLKNLDISGCKSLLSIGNSAFSNNFSLAGFDLPEVTFQNVKYKTWQDGQRNTYTAGINKATNLETNYLPFIPYTLTDNDVVVENGIIQSCSYNFALKNIIIPTTLDGQNVTGIKDGSDIFQNKGIISVQFPSSLLFIGNAAFVDNNIINLDLSGCKALKSIGISAFADNQISVVSLSACTALQTIGNSAFYNNKLTSLNLSGNSKLLFIGSGAFYDNQISTIDLSGCKSLVSIGSQAFFGNAALTGFDLPQVTSNGSVFSLWKDGKAKSYTAGTDKAADLQTFYFAVIPYTLKDSDVVVEDGVIRSCSYDFKLKCIIIPRVLDGQTVIAIADGNSSSGVFAKKDIFALQLPNTLQSIGAYAFSSNSISVLDLKDLTELYSLGSYAFYDNALLSLDLSGNKKLVSIGNWAFCSNKCSFLNLSGCSELVSIGDVAFNSNDLVNLDLTGLNKLVSIGIAAFEYNQLSNLDLSKCPALKTIGASAFRTNKISVLNLTANSQLQTIGSFAFDYNLLTNLQLSACQSLINIGESAFYSNKLTAIDLSGCRSLSYVEKGAFSNNTGLSGFLLPVSTFEGKSYDIWRNGNGKAFNGNKDMITDYQSFYLLNINKQIPLNNFNNVYDIVSDPGKKTICLIRYDSLYVCKNGMAELITLPYRLNDACLTDANLYAVCGNYLYRIPLDSLYSSIYIKDYFYWDPFVKIMARGSAKSDTLFTRIANFGSRSGWNIYYPKGKIDTVRWGHRTYPGYMDQVANNYIYVSSGLHERYDITKRTFKNLNVNIAGTFKMNGKSFIITNDAYSLNHGDTWTRFKFAYNITYYKANGYAQINDSVIAMADNYKDSILIIRNGKMCMTKTPIPDDFTLKLFDGSYLWGFTSYSTGRQLVKIPFTYLNCECNIIQDSVPESKLVTFEDFSDIVTKTDLSFNDFNGNCGDLDIYGKSKVEADSLVFSWDFQGKEEAYTGRFFSLFGLTDNIITYDGTKTETIKWDDYSLDFNNIEGNEIHSPYGGKYVENIRTRIINTKQVSVFLKFEISDINGTKIIKYFQVYPGENEISWDFRNDKIGTNNLSKSKLFSIIIEKKNDYYQIQNPNSGEIKIDHIKFQTKEAFPEPVTNNDLLNLIQFRAFQYFVDYVGKRTENLGLVQDRSTFPDLLSVGGQGFAFAAWLVGLHNNWIDEAWVKERVIKILTSFANKNNFGLAETGKIGYKGWFYHFLGPDGKRKINFDWPTTPVDESKNNVELSLIDSGLLLWGIYAIQSYFSRDNEIYNLCQEVINNIDWNFMLDKTSNQFFIGWKPGMDTLFSIPTTQGGFYSNKTDKSKLLADYYSDEYLLCNLSAMDKIQSRKGRMDVWNSLKKDKNANGTIISYPGALFTYQFFQLFYPAHQSPYLSISKWYNNSIKAMQETQSFCDSKKTSYKAYNAGLWGLSACEGPSDNYFAFGAPPVAIGGGEYDGTIAVYPIISALTYPDVSASAIQQLWTLYNEKGFFHKRMGFADAVNYEISETKLPGDAIRKTGKWVNRPNFAIDAGPMVMAIQNYKDGFIWDLVKRNPNVKAAIDSLAVDVKDYKQLDIIEIYPNPASSSIRIKSKNIYSIKEVKIIRSDGRSIQMIQKLGNDGTIDIGFLKPGIYLLRIDLDDNHVITKKFIKSN